MACPRCRVMLQLDGDSSGRPAYYRPRRRWALLRWAAVLGVFLIGLFLGFALGRASSAPASTGFTQNAFGFFFASNNMVVDERKVIPPPPKPKVPRADEDQGPRK
jgi:hypothetical protein